MSKKENNEEVVDNTEKETVENNQENNAEETQESNTEGLSDLEKKDIEYKELHEKYVRLFSEFDNFRKRTAKEKIDITMRAGGDIIKQLLPVIDDFERAIDNNEKAEDIDSVKEGFKLIHSKMVNNLQAKGLKAMDAKEKDFDVNHHEALTQIPAPSDDLKGKVIDVVEKGYFLNDKVLRFAKVVVGQ